MRITINGQLSLAMLYEMITEGIPGAIPLMQNTDGLETMIPREYQGKYMEICAEWEKITNLLLEHDTYSKVVLGDVNNYIAITESGSAKCKGRFEFENLALHKNKSFAVIAKAVFNYFVNGIKPEDYLKTNRNIYDYCGGKKIRGDWKFIEEFVAFGTHYQVNLQNTIRYYIANKGSKIVKFNYLDERQTQVEAGKWLQQLFIDYVDKPFEEYDINYDYYLTKAYKEIHNLEPVKNQLSLF